MLIDVDRNLAVRLIGRLGDAARTAGRSERLTKAGDMNRGRPYLLRTCEILQRGLLSLVLGVDVWRRWFTYGLHLQSRPSRHHVAS